MTSTPPSELSPAAALEPGVAGATAKAPWFSWELVSSRGHFNALDGVRGFGMLLVFLYHGMLYAPLRRPITCVWFAIEMFFVLSGFLITGLVVDAKGEPHYLRNFYVRRALRILPLYYLVLAVLYLWIWLSGDPGASRILSQQFYFWGHLQNVYMAFKGWYGPMYFSHMWSLSLEIHYYLAWPFLLSRMNTRQALVACCIGALFSFTLRNALPVKFPFSYVFTLTRLEGLMIGSAVALLFRTKRELLGRWAPTALVSGGIALLVLGFSRNGLFISDPWVMRLGYLFYPIFFGGLVTSLFDRGWTGRLTRWFFQLKPFLIIGKYSYGIFLCHWIIHLQLKRPLMDALRTATGSEFSASMISLAIQAVLTMAVSMATYHLIELRFLRMKSLFAPRTRTS